MLLSREKINFYLEDTETTTGKIINLTITGLILLSAVIFVAETYNLPADILMVLKLVNQIILVIFAIEYLVRLWCAENRLKFFFSIFSLIDLLAILPAFLGWLDIRFILLFRWFRILRLIRFIDVKISIFNISSEDGIIFTRILFTLFTIIFIFSGLIYQVEHPVNAELFNTFLDAFYFSVVTMTTVGFGDVTPLSQTGRLLTVLMILTGIALIPWQLGNLIKQLVKTTNKVEKSCQECGLLSHDIDANFCKKCGHKLS
jgi:voltage-gated potassium channel